MKDLINTGIQQLAGKANPIATLEGIVSMCHDMAVVEATEKTKREQILADKEVRIETIRAQRDFFMDYLKKTFDERADNFSKIFEVIDSALENDNIQQLALGLDSLNKLAAESPFKVLADINTLQNALENKVEFDF
jgi:hypothetical protein